MDSAILTPSSIWKDFTASGDLAASVIRESVENGVLLREVYFNAQRTEDGIVRVYGVFACPAESGRYPAVLYCPNTGAAVTPDNALKIAGCGCAVLAFDYMGETPSGRFTLYPKSIDYANYCRVGRHLLHVDTNARETSLYEWTRVARYAARYLSELPEVDPERVGVVGVRTGGYLAWQLAAFCPGLSCACSLFEAGWTEYLGKFKYSEDNDIAMDTERERWFAGLATQVYAAHVKVPFLYLGATNDRLGNMDRVADTLVRLTDGYASFAPRLYNMVNERSFETLRLFFESCWEQRPFWTKPAFHFEVTGRSLTVRLDAPGALSAEAYYALGEPDAAVRNWCAVALVEISPGVFTGEVPAYFSEQYVFGYGAARYPDGAYLSSNLNAVRPGEIGAEEKPAAASRMIYNASMGTDSFTVSAFSSRGGDADLFAPDEPVEMAEGAYRIYGVRAAQYDLTTYKIHDPRYRGEGDNLLKFDACQDLPGTLVVTVADGFSELAGPRLYVAEVKLIGGSLWQKVELSKADFKTESGVPLRDWAEAKALSFRGDGVLINNLLWL